MPADDFRCITGSFIDHKQWRGIATFHYKLARTYGGDVRGKDFLAAATAVNSIDCPVGSDIYRAGASPTVAIGWPRGSARRRGPLTPGHTASADGADVLGVRCAACLGLGPLTGAS